MDRVPFHLKPRAPATPMGGSLSRIPPLPPPRHHHWGSKARFDRSTGPHYPHEPPWRHKHGHAKTQPRWPPSS